MTSPVLVNQIHGTMKQSLPVYIRFYV